jgi:hypothetical protein
VPGQDGPHIEEDTMYPILSQALVAERAREWEDRAARYRLAKQCHLARREAARVAADQPGPRGGSRRREPQPAAPAAGVSVTEASRELVAVASGERPQSMTDEAWVAEPRDMT